MSTATIHPEDKFFGPSREELFDALEHDRTLRMTLEKDWSQTSDPRQIVFRVIGISREDGSNNSWILEIALVSAVEERFYQGVEASLNFGDRGGKKFASVLGRKIRVHYSSAKAEGRFLEF
ncbi:hypothetical protein IT414_02185 [bacterium]|nr:hypothetical protein [bacterium]